MNKKYTNYNLYTDGMIFSPAVPVFRDDVNNYQLLPEPYAAGIITAPAPNAGPAKSKGVS